MNLLMVLLWKTFLSTRVNSALLPVLIWLIFSPILVMIGTLIMVDILVPSMAPTGLTAILLTIVTHKIMAVTIS